MRSFQEWSKDENLYLDTLQIMEEEDRYVSRNNALRRSQVPSVTMGDLDSHVSHDLRGAWRTWVSDLVVPQLARHWMLFGTLTLRDWDGQAPGLRKGRKAMYDFCASIEDKCLSYVFVEERGTQNDRLHYHGLVRADRILHPAQGLLLQDYRRLWSAGYSNWDVARKVSGAVSYATKYIIKGQYAGETGFWAKAQNEPQQIMLED